MQTGKGNPFRRRSTFERFASKAGHIVPAPLWAAMRHGYQRALFRVRPESLVSTLPGGERIRLVPALRQLTWNTDEYDVFRRDVRPGDVVFDVGANLGAYTLLFAQWVGPAGRVFAFEPAREPFEGLTALLEVNGLSSRVTAMQAAVSGTEGTVPFLVDAVDGSSHILDDGDPRGAVQVQAVTIDSVCRREGVVPSLIKIDAEGAELDVLRGARATIAAGGSALKLYVEMHPRLWRDFSVMRAEIEAELAHQGLRARRLDGDPAIWNIEGVCLQLEKCGS